jgi:hypothetical protein
MNTPHPLSANKMTLTSSTSGDRSLGIVLSRTEATEFSSGFLYTLLNSPSKARKTKWSTELFVKQPYSYAKLHWGNLLLFLVHMLNTKFYRKRGSLVGWSSMIQAGLSQFRFSMRSLDFSIDLILPAALWPSGLLTSSSTEYRESSWGSKSRPARKADSLAANWEVIVGKMWQHGHLTTAWVSRACYIY